MIERLLPVVVMAAAGFYLVQSWQLPFGSAARPGAGFYPVAVAVFACVVALAATVRAFLVASTVRPASVANPDVHAQRQRVFITTAALAGFCFAMPWIGYPLAAAAFVIAALRGLGSRWWAALAIGVVSGAASHYLFAVLLDVPLPRGPW